MSTLSYRQHRYLQCSAWQWEFTMLPHRCFNIGGVRAVPGPRENLHNLQRRKTWWSTILEKEEFKYYSGSFAGWCLYKREADEGPDDKMINTAALQHCRDTKLLAMAPAAPLSPSPHRLPLSPLVHMLRSKNDHLSHLIYHLKVTKLLSQIFTDLSER